MSASLQKPVKALLIHGSKVPDWIFYPAQKFTYPCAFLSVFIRHEIPQIFPKSNFFTFEHFELFYSSNGRPL